MGAQTSKDPKVGDAKVGAEEKPKLKACCACPETKKARDECIVLNGEEHCGALIEAHKKCMREAGFNI
ncbi:Cytochrome c oxidase copper chaperone [Aphelenchoides fujianensis]|nr:Cytochrome c oxidase copper chaperone [Aphelenchoides fujianensis]